MLHKTKTVIFSVFVFAFAACNSGNSADAGRQTKAPATGNTAAAADPHALLALFQDAWNKKDSAAVVNMLADDAVLISGRTVMNGKNEIAGRFVHNNMPVTGNLKITDLQSNSGNELAAITGTWTLDVTVPGKPVTPSSGNHTFVWKKEADGAWKATVLNMEDHDPQTPQQAKN